MTMKPNGMFHTPANIAELTDWINAHTPSERPHLWTAAMMMHNLIASQLTDQ